jgi:hypothetical protein
MDDRKGRGKFRHSDALAHDKTFRDIRAFFRISKRFFGIS